MFNECDAALKQADVRDAVILCGPVSINNYNWPSRGGLSTDLMDTFLDQCKDSVNVVTLHSYSGSKDALGVLQAPHKLDFLFDSNRMIGPKDDYGLAALQAKMDPIKFGRGNVGVVPARVFRPTVIPSLAAWACSASSTPFFCRTASAYPF